MSLHRSPITTLSGALPLAALVLFGLLGGCDTDATSTIYDPDRPSLAVPVIDSVDPPGSALAGVDIVTITGQNFSSVAAENYVYFDATRAVLLEASPTQLRVVPPNEPKETAKVRVSVIGAVNFSNTIAYGLEAASSSFSDIKGFEEVFGVTSDADGNLYMSLFADSRSAGIKKVAPNGTRSDYVASTFKWDDLALGPDGYLYAARNIRALFRFQPGGGGVQETWAVNPLSTAKLATIDFDGDGYLWAGGNNADLYRIDPDKSITNFPFAVNVRSLKVWDGFLYVVGAEGITYKIWRFPLSAGTLGTPEVYFDFVQEVSATAQAIDLAFSAQGDLYVGTTLPDPVIVVHSDRSWESLYPGILKPVATAFAWGPDPFLYMVQGRTESTNASLIRINTRTEKGR